MQNNGVSVAIFFILLFFWIFFHSVSEQHLALENEHLAADELLDTTEFNTYKASCDDDFVVIST
jgi:hypothetical protein